MKTLLIAIDLSGSAVHVATYGYGLAQQLGANVILYHALNILAEMPQSGMVTWPANVHDDLTKDYDDDLAKLRFRLIAESAPDEYHPKVICAQGAGLVTDVLNNEVMENHADIVVMGMHNSNPLTTLMMGNHCREMIEATKLPLVLVPGRVARITVKRIAFACDFTDPENDIIMMGSLVIFAKKIDAEVILTHVHQRHDFGEYMLIGQHLVEDVKRKFDFRKLTFKIVKSKEVESGLTYLVAHEHIDMLAMVHREQSFLSSLLNGSYTQKAARQLKVPLLVLKPNMSIAL